MVNYSLSEETAKAVVCLIPLLPNMTTLVLDNNNISDPMCALFLLSAFMSPTLSSLEFRSSELKNTTAATLCELLRRWPTKIKHLGLAKSVAFADHLGKWTKHLV